MDETYPIEKTEYRMPAIRRVSTPEEKKERIKVWMGAALVITAGSIDLFQILLNIVGIGEVLSPIISIAADLLFIIWFWILGIGFMKSPKNFAAMAVQALIGLIPVLDTLPELTAGILVIVLLTRAEDKGGILGTLSGAAMSSIKGKYKQYGDQFKNRSQMGERQRRNLNRNIAVSKSDIVGEAVKRDPRFNQDQYGRALNLATDVINKKYDKQGENIRMENE